MIKYPRTPHLEGSTLQAGDTDHGQTRLADLGDEQVWEKKIDGANAAILFEEGRLVIQSRGTMDPRHPQFDLLKRWAARHETAFAERLGERYQVFGEWMHATHTIHYDVLPHYFLEFDILDRERNVFLSTDARRALLSGSPLVSVPVVNRGRVPNRKRMEAMVKPSLYKSGEWRQHLEKAALRAHGGHTERATAAIAALDVSDLAEGLYLKIERDGIVVARHKYVRRGFLQTILDSGTHWSARTIIHNGLAPGVDLFGE